MPPISCFISSVVAVLILLSGGGWKGCGPRSKLRKEDPATRNRKKSRNEKNLQDGGPIIFKKYFLLQILMKNAELSLIEDFAYIYIYIYGF